MRCVVLSIDFVLPRLPGRRPRPCLTDLRWTRSQSNISLRSNETFSKSTATNTLPSDRLVLPLGKSPAFVHAVSHSDLTGHCRHVRVEFYADAERNRLCRSNADCWADVPLLSSGQLELAFLQSTFSFDPKHFAVSGRCFLSRKHH